ncbi:sulfate/molybdate ABC transporter ATP-binding protein [Microvirga sp. VF16]|uniref:sulfate/molybdate ABC transporter ATP-binding protein n=1 Tax=Microvirga sp. VF16 TaxID=2807101 RepID=UPI00193D98B9|nr:sulfate ABC transporter ATP-binding protein [Microvirga sp. VF16]QRM32437.1 sulfate ABC transporter ATP-binding protein [Microvirga sp. VF16]
MAPISPVAHPTERSQAVDIRVAGVTKAFAGSAALHDVHLDVRPGELLALLGPSGSGKTTLLRIIAGLVEADNGQVFFGGVDATSLSVQKRQVGFVFQHYALFKHMSVADNIGYGLRVRERANRPSKAEIRRRTSELLDLVQLSGYESRFPAQLSGGQRQRVALARALAVEPRVLLLDEPFGALDAKVRKDLRAWLRDIHERTGKTTVFVTHDQDEALELADRVAVLDRGHLEQVGSPDDVQDHPATPFVMTFLGQAARFNADIRDGRALVNGKLVPVAAPKDTIGQASLYCRPWHLKPVHAGHGHHQGIISGVRRLGSMRRIEVLQVDGTKLEVEVPLVTNLRVGEQIGLDILDGVIFRDG